MLIEDHHFMFEFLLAILYTSVQCTSMAIIILLIHGSVTNEAMQKAGCALAEVSLATLVLLSQLEQDEIGLAECFVNRSETCKSHLG